MEAIGPYRVERCLGAGTFAVVWLAVDPLTSRRYAIKVLGDTWNRHDDIRQRFYREARLLWHADSDRIINIETVGELESGQPYIVMDYASGGTLKTRLAEQRLIHGALLDIATATRLVEELALCVADVHSRGAVHRDLKPENVLIQRTAGIDGSEEDHLVLGDFGLAKYVSHDSALSATVGTPGYMPPEQWLGSGRIGCQADVYSLGALAYEIFANRPAFRPDVAVDERQIPDIGLARADVPPHIQALLRSSMQPDPEVRPADASAFARALTSPLPVSVALAPPSPLAQRPKSRQLTAVAVAVLSVVGTAILTIATGFRSEAAVPVDVADLAAVTELQAVTDATDDDVTPSVASAADTDADAVEASAATPTQPLPAAAPSSFAIAEPPEPSTPSAAPTTTVAPQLQANESFAVWFLDLAIVEIESAGPPAWSGSTKDPSELRTLMSDELASMGISHERRDDGTITVFFADGSVATLSSSADGAWSYSLG